MRIINKLAIWNNFIQKIKIKITIYICYSHYQNNYSVNYQPITYPETFRHTICLISSLIQYVNRVRVRSGEHQKKKKKNAFKVRAEVSRYGKHVIFIHIYVRVSVCVCVGVWVCGCVRGCVCMSVFMCI